jgi:PAS domain S-box-containing protein
MKTGFDEKKKVAAPFSHENSELLFRSLVENINDVLFALTPAGVFSYVSPQWKVAFGYEPCETIGQPFMPFVHPDDVPGCLAFLQLVLDTGEQQSGIEYRVLCRDGRYLWYRANASLVKDPVTGAATVVGIARDIAEHKQLEEFLEESREKFRCLSDAAYEAIFISEKGLCLEQNKRAEELFGYSTAEAVGRPGTDWIVPEDRDLVLKNMMAGCEMPYEVSGVRKDGSTFPALIRGRMMQLKGRTVRVTSMTDITDRKELHKYRDHLEELVKERTAELETVNEALAKKIQQSQKARKDIESLNIDLQQRSEAMELVNRELESFSYSVSHDLQAPLRHIAGYSKILLEDYGDKIDADANNFVKRIGQAVNKMGLLIDSLLGLSSISRTGLMLQKIDLSRMATEIVAELQEGAQERNVRFEIAAGLVTIADSNLMRAMLQNLLGNAWKYTREVSAAVISFSSQQKDGLTVYCLRDNGAGFDMAHAGKLFGAFQRMHGPEYEGTGIGLATVQRIIQRHGGTIWFEAEPGKGASFYFTLDSR